MKPTTDFFTTKREWSVLKDQILDYYLTPYLSKILYTKRPTRIADCFAGPGRFGDGSEGSPLIISRHIAKGVERDPSIDLKGIFIEQKYAAELSLNLAVYGDYCKVLEGDYESRIKNFIEMQPEKCRNYFLYIDPFGIKPLAFKYFQNLKALGIKSLELLLNLNSTGFLREGQRLLKLTREAPDWAHDLDYEVDGRNTAEHMDDVAGGKYWREILENFETDNIDFHQAEVDFTNHYVDVMRSVFRYVVNIPIKERSHHMPKYRLIFAGDNIDGLLLMTKSMNRASKMLKTAEMGAQLYLFDDKELVSIEHQSSIQDLIWNELSQPLLLEQLLATLVEKHGIVYTGEEYSAAIRKSENDVFAVERTPSVTPGGRKATGMDYKKCKIVVSRKSKQEKFF